MGRVKIDANLAFLAGLWHVRALPKGIGIFGSGEVQQKFLSSALKAGVPVGKIKIRGRKIFFWHAKIANTLRKIIAQRADIFERKTKITAAYFRGLWEGSGKGNFVRGDEIDQALIERAGFYTKRKGRIIMIRKFEDFLTFIR